MKTLSTTVATASVILGASLLVATPASAEERICRGTIGAVTLDNVKVPSGATCTLSCPGGCGGLQGQGGSRRHR